MRVHVPPSRSARSPKRHAPGKAEESPPPGAGATARRTKTAAAPNSQRSKKSGTSPAPAASPGACPKPTEKKATTLVKKKLLVAKKPLKKSPPVTKKTSKVLAEASPPGSPSGARKSNPGSANRSPTRPETAQESAKVKAKPKQKKAVKSPVGKAAEESPKAKKKALGTKAKRESEDPKKKIVKKVTKLSVGKVSPAKPDSKGKPPVKKSKLVLGKDAPPKKSPSDCLDSSEDSDELLSKSLSKGSVRKGKGSPDGVCRPKMASPRRDDVDAAPKSKAKSSDSAGRVTSPTMASKEEAAKKKAAPKQNVKRPSEPERRSSIPPGQTTSVALVSLPTVSLQKIEKQVVFDTKVEHATTGDKKKITARRKLASPSTSAAEEDTAKSPHSPKNAGLIGKIVPKPLTDLLESRASEAEAKKAKTSSSLKHNVEPETKSKPALHKAVTIKKIKWNDAHVTKKKDAGEKGSKVSAANKHVSKTTSTLLAAKEKLAQWKAMVEHDEDSNSSDNVPLDLLFRGNSESPADVTVEKDTSSSGLASSFKITPEMSENARAEAAKKKIFRKSCDGEKHADKQASGEERGGKKPKDVYEFGLSSSEHGMSDSSLKKERVSSLMDKRKALQRKRVRMKNAKTEKAESPTRVEGSGSDTDQKVKRFRLLGFWSGPKRHRLASLNAIAKVHCMFENESRPAFLGGFVSSPAPKPRNASPRAAAKSAPRGKPGPKRKVPKEKNESDNESVVEPAITTRALRTGHGIRGAGKHWDINTAESTSSSDPPSSSSSSDNESSSDAATDPDAPKGSPKRRHKRPGTPQEKQQSKEKKEAETKRRRKKREPSMDLKDMVVRKRMASLNATAILAASYCNEKKSPRKDSNDDHKKDSQIVPRSPAQPSPRVRPSSPSPILDGSEKEKPFPSILAGEGDEKVVLDDRHVIELRSSAGKGTTLILNKDADVTITGLYVNSTTRSTAHHEGFCSFAGLQYHISSTSHTQTEATAVTTETVIQTDHVSHSHITPSIFNIENLPFYVLDPLQFVALFSAAVTAAEKWTKSGPATKS